ncbi:Glutamyl-tRNA amidotransferase subunit B, mitochondrial [Phyllosticta citribraziliensis]|uniref:Glutamyl-tRNA(Gln) amidotransferase subunit B, mitochondrial n=1 Tax=Phyllosticta citribraziliensis TaxID=989973 RepID=A0ABR1LCH7_9PEZI
MHSPRLRSSLALPLRPSRYVCASCLQSRIRPNRPFQFVPQLQARSLHANPQHHEELSFRAQQKEEAKRRRAETGSKSSKGKSSSSASPLDARLDKWELTVGIEIHAELNTARKLFSPAATSSSAAPNSHVAPFDVAFPGTQPQFQQATLVPALRAALAMGCRVQRKSSFDRKHYFYQDQPAGYQITQYYEPFARDGAITLYDYDGIAPEDGRAITIGIKQVQMEQDTAKTLAQPPATSLLDFNRVSHPLVEIITLPQIHHPATAAACVRKIQAVLKSVNAVTAGMEAGGLRADVNVSVRRRGGDAGDAPHSYYGVAGLGQRTEIKNLNTFKAVEEAIRAEMARQIDVLEAGGKIEGETRAWTTGGTETRKLRGKEGEVDYRYMPDPDLGPVIIGDDLLQHLASTLPELPDQTLHKLVHDPQYGLTIKDAKTLLAFDGGDRLDYYFDVVRQMREQTTAEEQKTLKLGRVAGNWIIMELGTLLTTSGTPFTPHLLPPPSSLARLLLLLLRRRITTASAKLALSTLFFGDNAARDVDRLVAEHNLLLRPMSRAEYVDLAAAVLAERPQLVDEIRAGRSAKVMWFVGQMMRRGEEGRVEAERAKAVLEELIAGKEERE